MDEKARTIYGGETFAISVPELSEWRAHLLDSVIYQPRKGEEPNRFHRFMQRLAFGIRWEKVHAPPSAMLSAAGER